MQASLSLSEHDKNPSAFPLLSFLTTQKYTVYYAIQQEDHPALKTIWVEKRNRHKLQ